MRDMCERIRSWYTVWQVWLVGVFTRWKVVVCGVAVGTSSAQYGTAKCKFNKKA